jgi:glycosyltransferase involved in cell wall biosynthesis
MRSLLGQSYEHIEVVISDQASTDRSLEIVRSFDDRRVRVLPDAPEELNLHSNWARGLAAAKGEFVKIMCQDDLLLPACLSTQMDLLQRYPSAALVCGRRRIIDDQDRVLIKRRGLGRLIRAGETRAVEGPAVARACTRAGSNLLGEPVNVLIRRSALPYPLFDTRWKYTIDLEFYLRCLGNGEAVVDSRVLCCFRVSPSQLSAVLAKSQARELREFLSDVALRYPDQVSATDVFLGSARAQLLSQARQILYREMRVLAVVKREFHSHHNSVTQNAEAPAIQVKSTEF